MKPRTAVPGLALLAVLLAAALAGCSGADSNSADGSLSGGSSAGDSGRDAGGSVAAEAPVPAEAEVDGLTDSALRSGLDYSVAGGKNRVQPEPGVMTRAVIRKGNVALRADDVGKTQFQVQQVVDRYSGQVTEEKTTTDDDGDPAYTRMVLRIPTAQFGDAMEALQGIESAELESATSSEDDVTTQLIDTQTRLAAQRRSIARITVLFDRAQSIREIMAIESELSRRQADLDSLQHQAAYLRGQSSLSTIVVSVDEIPAKVAPTEKADQSGFVAGLSAGWDALTGFAVALATALGALLPWLVVLGILGPPVYLLVRWVRRRLSARSSARTPSAA